VLLPEDGSQLPKHIGGKIIYFYITLYMQVTGCRTTKHIILHEINNIKICSKKIMTVLDNILVSFPTFLPSDGKTWMKHKKLEKF
jgi:hypothetical protein